METQFNAAELESKMKFQIESNISGELKVLGIYKADDKQGVLESMARSGRPASSQPA